MRYEDIYGVLKHPDAEKEKKKQERIDSEWELYRRLHRPVMYPVSLQSPFFRVKPIS
ncbi:MAG: hypothetical protein ACYCSB_01305 [bacterium]